MVKSKSNANKMNAEFTDNIFPLVDIHNSINPSVNTVSFTSKYTGDDEIKSRNKRGRKPLLMDHAAKVQRCRQSAKDCRVRKKLRYQHLANAVLNLENENLTLLKEYYAVRYHR